MAKAVDELKQNFQKIRNDLEEHLTTINENTSEIQSMFDFLQEIDTKIEKLSQRLDQFQLGTKNFENQNIVPLNHIERKIFLILYTEELALTTREVANRSKLFLSVVQECLTNLNKKGIPLIRTHVNNQLFVKLDPRFKELQAKENIVNLSLESFM